MRLHARATRTAVALFVEPGERKGTPLTSGREAGGGGPFALITGEWTRGQQSAVRPGEGGTSAPGARCPYAVQLPCLSPRSSCPCWDSSLSPPPVTSRTAPGEGNERCRRPGSDRFGEEDDHSSFPLIFCQQVFFFFVCFVLDYNKQN